MTWLHSEDHISTVNSFLYHQDPDLVPRLVAGVPLDTKYDYSTFYSNAKEGYSDFLNYDQKVEVDASVKVQA